MRRSAGVERDLAAGRRVEDGQSARRADEEAPPTTASALEPAAARQRAAPAEPAAPRIAGARMPLRDTSQRLPSGVSVMAMTSSAGSESATRGRCLNVRNACACGSSRLTPPFQVPIQRLPIASS